MKYRKFDLFCQSFASKLSLKSYCVKFPFFSSYTIIIINHLINSIIFYYSLLAMNTVIY